MSPQIQRLRMRLLRFDFSLITADTLFRAPVARQDDQYRTEEEIDLYVQHVSASLSASNTQFERIREKQEDEVCQTLRQYCNQQLGQIVPEYQTHLNLTGRLRMISRLSMDCS